MLGTLVLCALTAAAQPFRITVVDDATGRGLPLVELHTVNEIVYVTDSAGEVAFDEPGLLGRPVFFHVSSHGCSYPKDGFGYHGVKLNTTPGGHATIKVHRNDLAERLYRLTGAGIYRDSQLLGLPVPLRQPVLCGGVLGQDTVLAAVYRGRIHWFWGDTNRSDYPLGNFNTPGAVSALPSAGGLDPSVGVDYEYFVDAHGFARPAAPMPGPGPTWLGGLVVLGDRMFGAYAKIRGNMEAYERGLMEWDDAHSTFVKRAVFAAGAKHTLDGHPFVHEGQVYCGHALPFVRVAAQPAALADPANYERWNGTAWVKDGAPLSTDGLLRDADTGDPLHLGPGNTCWNPYLQRWLLVANARRDRKPDPLLGVVYVAAADRLTGPWTYARRVVTMDRYSLYNPVHHEFFDQQDGRLIYFEGTYTRTFTDNPVATPRYDYNQLMHRLDLGGPRLRLPVAVYRQEDGRYALRGSGQPAFWACERTGEGLVPLELRGGLTIWALPLDSREGGATTVEFEGRGRVWRSAT